MQVFLNPLHLSSIPPPCSYLLKPLPLNLNSEYSKLHQLVIPLTIQNVKTSFCHHFWEELSCPLVLPDLNTHAACSRNLLLLKHNKYLLLISEWSFRSGSLINEMQLTWILQSFLDRHIPLTSPLHVTCTLQLPLTSLPGHNKYSQHYLPVILQTLDPLWQMECVQLDF